MKKILYSLVTALFVLSFSACNNNDTEGVYYHAKNTEVAFAKASGSYFFAGTDPGEYNVTLIRGNANGEASVPVTMADESGYFTVPATVNFADGAYEADLTVTFNKEALEIGKKYTISLSIPENPIAGKLIKYSLSVTRDYTWENIGTGMYYSQFFGESWEQPVDKAKEGNIYRLPDCIYEGYPLVFTLSDDGQSLVSWDPQPMGYVDATYGMIYYYSETVQREGNYLSFPMLGLVEWNGGLATLYGGFVETVELP